MIEIQQGLQILSMLPAWALAVLSGLAMLPLAFGAVTVAEVYRSADRVLWTVIATADGDVTTGNIAHGLGVIPHVTIRPALSQALTALSAWTVAVPDVTNIVGTKLASTGSGNAGVQLVIQADRPR